MHHLLLRAIGAPQTEWQREALDEFLKKLKPFAKVEIIELPEGHGGSAKPDEAKTRKAEAESLLKSIPADTNVVALDETGKNLDSPSFAHALEDWTDGGRTVVFLIGGSWGLDPTVRQAAQATISFGKQTLPHLLARIVLLEQLYRAETILAGKTYHK